MTPTSPTSRIENLDQLRAVLGEPHPELGEKNAAVIDEFALAFISRCPLIVLSTADADGRIDASPKGDAPGFVSVVDEKTLLIPDRPGNKLAYGHQNILSNPRVGILFIIPNTPETLRINGTAELHADPTLLDQLAARGKPAVLSIRVSVEECFFHCGKAFIRSDLWKSETWGERHRVSFGRQWAKRKQQEQNQDLVDAIDRSIDEDYRTNL